MKRFVIACALIGCGKSGESKQATDQAVSKPAVVAIDAAAREDVRTAQAIEVTAGKLYDEYVANETGADATYKGKVLRVAGIVDHVVAKDDEPYVVLQAAGGDADVRAIFGTKSGLGELRKWDEVAMRCRGDNFFGKPRLFECVLDPQSGSKTTQP